MIQGICGEILKDDITLCSILVQCNGDLRDLLDTCDNEGHENLLSHTFDDILSNSEIDTSDSEASSINDDIEGGGDESSHE